jgi:hypothetical protein
MIPKPPVVTSDAEDIDCNIPTYKAKLAPHALCPPVGNHYVPETTANAKLKNVRDFGYDETCVGEPLVTEVALPVKQRGEYYADENDR